MSHPEASINENQPCELWSIWTTPNIERTTILQHRYKLRTSQVWRRCHNQVDHQSKIISWIYFPLFILYIITSLHSWYTLLSQQRKLFYYRTSMQVLLVILYCVYSFLFLCSEWLSFLLPNCMENTSILQIASPCVLLHIGHFWLMALLDMRCMTAKYSSMHTFMHVLKLPKNNFLGRFFLFIFDLKIIYHFSRHLCRNL